MTCLPLQFTESYIYEYKSLCIYARYKLYMLQLLCVILNK